MRNRLIIPLLLTASLLVAGCSDNTGPSGGDENPAPMPMAENETMPMGMATPNPNDSPATQGYKQAMTEMRANMPAFTGEADADFMRQMKVHHQSAIAMAETVLRYGDDPQVQALAEKIIREQRAEIAEIDAWWAANNG